MIRQVDKSGFTGDSDMANADTPYRLGARARSATPKRAVCLIPHLAKAELKVVHLRFRS